MITLTRQTTAEDQVQKRNFNITTPQNETRGTANDHIHIQPTIMVIATAVKLFSDEYTQIRPFSTLSSKSVPSLALQGSNEVFQVSLKGQITGRCTLRRQWNDKSLSGLLTTKGTQQQQQKWQLLWSRCNIKPGLCHLHGQ